MAKTQPISGRADYHLHSVKDRLADVSSAKGLSMAAFPDEVRPEVFGELEKMGFEIQETAWPGDHISRKTGIHLIHANTCKTYRAINPTTHEGVEMACYLEMDAGVTARLISEGYFAQTLEADKKARPYAYPKKQAA